MARSGTPPIVCTRSFTRSLRVQTMSLAPRLACEAAIASRRRACRRGGRGTPARRRRSQPSASSVWRKPAGLPMPQNATTGFPRKRFERRRSRRRSDQRSGAVLDFAPHGLRRQFQRPSANGVALRRRRACRRGSARRRRRAAAQRPARAACPRGSRWSKPNGSLASSSTMSRSRASRRCWKPSSSTRSCDASSSTATAAEAPGRDSAGAARRAARAPAPGPRRSAALGGPVAAAEDRDAHALPPQMAGDPLDHRRLAGAADGEVADADHRHGGPVDLGGAAVVAAIAGAHDPAVGNAGGAQAGSQQPGGHAAAAAADEVAKCGGGNHKGCGVDDQLPAAASRGGGEPGEREL